jgi:HEAT repeat protein
MKYIFIILIIVLNQQTQEEKIKTLFDDAALWQVGENIEKVDKAREELIQIGKPVLEYMYEEKLNTDKTLELRAIEAVTKELKSEALPLLFDKLEAENDTIRKNVAWLLGKIVAKDAPAKLIPMLDKEKDHKVKANMIEALGSIGDTAATTHIIPYLENKKEVLRIRSAEALGKLKDKRAANFLIDESLKDEFFTVRGTAIWALGEIGEGALPIFLERLNNTKRDTLLLISLIDVLGKIGEKIREADQKIKLNLIKKAILPYLESENWILRGYAVEALARVKTKGVFEILKTKYEVETHPFVLRKYEEVIKQEL